MKPKPTKATFLTKDDIDFIEKNSPELFSECKIAIEHHKLNERIRKLKKAQKDG